MAAFVEKLCEHVGIVRVGPHATTFGMPYARSATYVLKDGYAIVKGFTESGFATSEYREAITAINDAEGKLVAYDRAGPPPIRLIQLNPELTNGRIIMRKHHVSEAKKPDGTVDHAKVAEGMAYWMGEIQSGRASIIAGDQSDLPNGDTLIWFVRHH